MRLVSLMVPNPPKSNPSPNPSPNQVPNPLKSIPNPSPNPSPNPNQVPNPPKWPRQYSFTVAGDWAEDAQRRNMYPTMWDLLELSRLENWYPERTLTLSLSLTLNRSLSLTLSLPLTLTPSLTVSLPLPPNPHQVARAHPIDLAQLRRAPRLAGHRPAPAAGNCSSIQTLGQGFRA